MSVARKGTQLDRESTWMQMEPFAGATWSAHYGSNVLLGGGSGPYVRGGHAIHERANKPFTQYRVHIFFNHTVNSNTYLDMWLGDSVENAVMSWNRLSSASQLFPAGATNILQVKTKGWYTITGVLTYVYFQLKEKGSGSDIRVYGVLLEYE